MKDKSHGASYRNVSYFFSADSKLIYTDDGYAALLSPI